MSEVDDLISMADKKLGISKPVLPMNQQSSIETENTNDEVSDLIKMASNPKEFTVGQRALQPAHGVASTYGSLADLISRTLIAPWIKARAEENVALGREFDPELASQNIEKFSHPQAQQYLTGQLDKLAGRSLQPQSEDTLGKILHTGGELAAPLPIPGGGGYIKAVQKGLPALGKFAGKEAAMATGAATALQAPSITEEGGLGRAAEDFTKMALGAKAATTNPAELVKSTIKVPSTIAAKGLSYFSKPDKEVIDYAKKHGITLPFNVGTNNPVHNWVSNNYLKKSIFTSSVYRQALKKADDSMIKSVKDSIDTLGTSQLKPHEASSEYRMYLKEQEELMEQQKKVLYDEAYSKLRPTDVVSPQHTARTISSMSRILDRDIQAPGTKKVADILAKLGGAWGIIPDKAVVKVLEGNPTHLLPYLASFKNIDKKVPVDRLIGVTQDLGMILKHEPEVRGVENLLNGLKGALEKDIETTTNKTFLNDWRSANKFFKEEIADRFRTDLARSLMTREIPLDAYTKMNNIESIKLLEKSAGNEPKAKEIIDALKKAKVREIIKAATVGGLEKGSLSTAVFANLFNKGEKKQELLEYLLGKKEYNKMYEIGRISQAFSDAGKDLLNTSGTAITSKDFSKADAAGLAVLGFLFGNEPLTGVVIATSAMATPNLLSRVVVNPKIMDQARAYALARQKGNEKYAETVLKKLINMIEKEKKAIQYTAIRGTEEDKASME